MNPIKGFSFEFKNECFIITERWSSGKITYQNKETGKKHYSTIKKFKENEKKFRRL